MPIDERNLVADALGEGREGFGRLVRAYQRRAYAAAYRYVGNREDALELAQEAFVRAYRALHQFDPERPFYPWLYRIVKNCCLNHLKRKSRHGEYSLDEWMESGHEIPDPGAAPSESAELGGLRHAMRAAMAQLSEEHREILRLRHFLELSYAEIAECLGVPQGTVMSRLHAARKALRRELETHHPEWAEEAREAVHG